MSALEVATVLDSAPTKPMRHVLSLTPSKRLCGSAPDMSKPVTWGPVDCVVCLEIWQGMSFEEQKELIRFWGSRR